MLYPWVDVGLVLFNIIINNLDNRLSKFADDRKLEGVEGMLDCCAAIQREQDRLENWTKKSHEVQQKEIQTPASVEKESQEPVHTGSQMAGK